jgi:hypothetical protein
MLGISLGISLVLTAAQYTDPNPTQADQYAAASRSALEATYKESGLEKDIERLEKQYVSEQDRQLAGHMLVFSRLLIEKRVEFKWTF